MTNQQCGQSSLSFSTILHHQNEWQKWCCGPYQQGLGTCWTACINWNQGFRPLDDYDILEEPFEFIPDSGSHIRDKRA